MPGFVATSGGGATTKIWKSTVTLWRTPLCMYPGINCGDMNVLTVSIGWLSTSAAVPVVGQVEKSRFLM